MKRASLRPARRARRRAHRARASSSPSASPPAATRSGTRRGRATGSAARSSSSRAAAAATRWPTPARPGTIGPNLDFAFAQSRIDGLGESTILQVVRDQIAYPVDRALHGRPGMPADIFTGQDAEDVASYVAAVAGLDANGEADRPCEPAEADAPPRAARRTARRSSPRRAAAAATRSPRRARAAPSARTSTRRSRRLDLAIDRVTNGQGGMPSFKGQLSEAADRGRREVRRRQRRQVARTAAGLGPASRSTTTCVIGHVVALARELDDALLEPVRASRWVRREHDLVRRELPERVLERLKRVAVADLASRGHPDARELREARVEPRLGGGARAVLVRRPGPDASS